MVVCLCASVCAHSSKFMCLGMHACVCVCAHPQRYFNLGRILKKHGVAVARCLPIAWFGGVAAMTVGGEEEGGAAHGQSPRRTHWRLFLEDF